MWFGGGCCGREQNSAFLIGAMEEVAISLCVSAIKEFDRLDTSRKIQIDVPKLFGWWCGLPEDIKAILMKDELCLAKVLGLNNYCLDIVKFQNNAHTY